MGRAQYRASYLSSAPAIAYLAAAAVVGPVIALARSASSFVVAFLFLVPTIVAGWMTWLSLRGGVAIDGDEVWVRGVLSRRRIPRSDVESLVIRRLAFGIPSGWLVTRGGMVALKGVTPTHSHTHLWVGTGRKVIGEQLRCDLCEDSHAVLVKIAADLGVPLHEHAR